MAVFFFVALLLLCKAFIWYVACPDPVLSLFIFFRMIDWLSWPLANHVDTWVIALLKGLAAVQKFTILIDVTLLKIEQVCVYVLIKEL